MINERLTLNLNKLMIFVFLFGLIVFDNGSIEMKGIKVIVIISAFFLAIKNKMVFPNFYIKWMVIFTIYAASSTLWAHSKGTSLAAIKTIVLNLMCLYAYMQLLKNNPSNINLSFRLITFFPVIYMLRLVFQYGIVSLRVGFRGIAGAASSMHNHAGMYSAFALCLLYVLKKQAKHTYKGLINILFIGNLIFLIMSGSRKSILYFVIPLLIYYLLQSSNPKRILRNLFIIICGLTFGYFCIMEIPFLYKMIGSGLESIVSGLLGQDTDSSTSARIRLIKWGLSIYKHHPLWGYGIENFKILHAKSYGSQMIADNNYIELLVDQGFFGLIIYYSFHIALIYKLLKCRSKVNNNILINMFIGIEISILICDLASCTYRSLFIQVVLCSLWMALQLKTKSNVILQ